VDAIVVDRSQVIKRYPGSKKCLWQDFHSNFILILGLRFLVINGCFKFDFWLMSKSVKLSPKWQLDAALLSRPVDLTTLVAMSRLSTISNTSNALILPILVQIGRHQIALWKKMY